MRISDWSSDVCSSDLVVVRGRNEKRFLPGLATVTAAQDPAVVADRQHELVVEEFDLGQSRAALRLHLGLMPRSLDAIGVKDVALFTDREQIGRAHAELQSLMRISYAVFCLKKKKIQQ